MDQSIVWFLIMATLSVAGFAAGRQLGRARLGRVSLWLTLAMVLLALWVWLYNHPDIAVKIIPLSILSQIEGTAAAPMFMLILGVAWARSKIARQRFVVLAAIAVGVMYFIRGGLWMIQPMPASALADEAAPDQIVMQSQDFTCVPAACATALNALGIPSTESQMAELTQTRIGEGATVIRAVDGLTQRLDQSPWVVELILAPLDDFIGTRTPILTAILTGQTQRHMVAILAVSNKYVLVADPIDGLRNLPREEFDPLYTGQAITFRRK